MSNTVPPGVLLPVGCGRALLPEGLADRHWREIRYDIDPSVEPDLIGSMTDMAQIASCYEGRCGCHNENASPIRLL